MPFSEIGRFEGFRPAPRHGKEGTGTFISSDRRVDIMMSDTVDCLLFDDRGSLSNLDCEQAVEWLCS